MTSSALNEFREHFKLKLQKLTELCDETKEQQIKLSEVLEDTKNTKVGQQCKKLFKEINTICTLRKQSVQYCDKLVEGFIKEQESHENTIKNISTLIGIILNSETGESPEVDEEVTEDTVEDTVQESDYTTAEETDTKISKKTVPTKSINEKVEKKEDKKTVRKEKSKSETKKFRLMNQYFVFKNLTKFATNPYIDGSELDTRKAKTSFVGKFWTTFQNDDSTSDMYSWFNAQYGDIKKKVDEFPEEEKKKQSELLFTKMYEEFEKDIGDDLLSEEWISDNKFEDTLNTLVQDCM